MITARRERKTGRYEACFWATADDRVFGTDGWHWRLRFWRMQLQLTVFRHSYGQSSDRWVIQPHVVYDRKRP